MLTDRVVMVSGAEIINAHAESGDSFPANPSIGRLFYLTSDVNPSTSIGLYIFDGTTWQTGDISAVLSGTGLIGGGSTGAITLSVDETYVAKINSPTFTGTVVLPATTSIGAVTDTEINYLAGTTANIQTQLINKASSNNTTLTGTVTLPVTTTIGSVNGTTINYLSGTTSNIQTQIGSIQTQLGNKLDISGGTMTGNIIMSANTTITLPTPAGGFSSTNAVNKAYVDALAAGVVWLAPVLDPNLINDTSTAPPITSDNSVYIVGSSPTGLWSGLAGHAVHWNGTGWTDLLSRAVMVGDRFGVALENGTVSGGLTGNAGKIATVTNATPGAIAYNFTTPVESNSVFVNMSASAHFGHAYTYVNSNWIEFVGMSGVVDGIGLQYTGNVLNVNLGAGVTQLPSDEIGVDIYPTGGLMTTIDGTNSDTTVSAQLSLTKVGTAGSYFGVTTDAYGRVTSGSNNLPIVGTAGTYFSVTTDAYGRVTSGNLTPDAVGIAGSYFGVTTDAYGRVVSGSATLPIVGTAGTYSNVTTDAYGRVTSGDNNPGPLATIGTAGTYNSVTTDAYGRVTSGSNSSVSLPHVAILSDTLTTTSNTANQILDSFDATVYRSVKYQIQITSGTDYQCDDIQILHDDTVSRLVVYSSLITNNYIATYETTITAGYIKLLVSPATAASTTFKFIATYIQC